MDSLKLLIFLDCHYKTENTRTDGVLANLELICQCFHYFWTSTTFLDWR